EAFFATSSSRVSRPTSRSSSATRAASRSSPGAPPKTPGRRSRKVFFQRATSSGLSPWARQRSAWDCAPVRTASTTSALNCGVKDRRVRFAIEGTSEGTRVHYPTGPASGAHFIEQGAQVVVVPPKGEPAFALDEVEEHQAVEEPLHVE